MNNVKWKKSESALPDGYIGMRNNDDDGFEYCEASTIVMTWAFTGKSDCPDAEFIHFRGSDGDVLDYVITPGGRVTNGASVWRNLKALLSDEQELSCWNSTSIFLSIIWRTI